MKISQPGFQDVSQCVCCGSRGLRRYAAEAAPFLASRIASLQGIRIELLRCSRCEFAFFIPRLNGAQMAELYRGYRGVDYQAERQRFEPDYTPEFNALIGSGETEVRSRKANMRSFLGPWLETAAIGSVLDYGGDRGQYILEEFGQAQRFVYEISGVDPLPGVTSLADWDSAKAARYDLILCNHVLEHVPFPGDLLRELAEVAHPDSRLYFEVPLESPFRPVSAFSPKHALRRLGLAVLPAFTNALMRNPRRKPFLMHEHVNYYSLASFRRLVTGHGFQVLALGESTLDMGWGTMRVISCLAKLR
jgi:SAM-dependent methyltransferase